MISTNEGMLVVAGFAVFALAGIALALAVAALRARALFVASVCGGLIVAAVSAALLATGAVLPAIALVTFGAALLVVWILGGMLLSANSVKATRRGAPWLTFGAALVAAGLIMAVAAELSATHAAVSAEPAGLPALITMLVFVTGVIVLGLLGYGERGAFERRGREAP